ncbi:MAG: hypothetical protein U1F37_10460 [Alphaproteobacteria bacterium]
MTVARYSPARQCRETGHDRADRTGHRAFRGGSRRRRDRARGDRRNADRARAAARHCLLERAHPADRNIIETVERVVAGSNRVLAAFADCEQRADVRAGRRAVLDDFGQYMTSVRGGAVPSPRRSSLSA